MVQKVFKFPDGKGGFILKILGEDEKWHLCDADGNYLEEEKPKKEAGANTTAKARKSAQEKKNVKGSPSIRLSVSASIENGELINDYVHWKSLNNHEYFSRSNFMIRSTIAAINKDQDFSEYLKSKQ